MTRFNKAEEKACLFSNGEKYVKGFRFDKISAIDIYQNIVIIDGVELELDKTEIKSLLSAWVMYLEYTEKNEPR